MWCGLTTRTGWVGVGMRKGVEYGTVSVLHALVQG